MGVKHEAILGLAENAIVIASKSKEHDRAEVASMMVASAIYLTYMSRKNKRYKMATRVKRHLREYILGIGIDQCVFDDFCYNLTKHMK